MNIRPTRTFMRCLWLIGISFLIHISCSKDNDVFLDAVLEKQEKPVLEDDTIEEDSVEEVEEVEEETDSIPEVTEDLESRITIFPAVNDAYTQNGKGFDESLIRLEENLRRSYLMFDLTPIDSINGNITAAKLRFNINSDAGNGTIKVFASTSIDWSEDSLTEQTAPPVENQIGEIVQDYKVDDEIEIELNVLELLSGGFTLILEHEDGDDLAFASKENTTKPGPKLEVIYEAPVSSEELSIDDAQVIEESEESTADESTEDNTDTEEDTTDDETTEEDSTEDNTGTEEDTTDDETTEEDSTEDNTDTEEDTTDDETTEEDSTEDNTDTEEDTTDDETTEEDSTEDNTDTEEDTTDDETTEEDSTEDNTDTEEDATDDETTEEDSTEDNIGTEEDATDDETTEDNPTEEDTIPEENPNTAPTAKAQANPVSGIVPLEVDFNANSSSDDKAITSFEWDFQDGSASTSATPTHTFSQPGSYNVSLKVTDEDGLSGADVITITVAEKPNEAPIAIASANIFSGEAPLSVNFTGSDSTDDKGIVSYLWDFQDATSSEANPSYTFMNAGSYTVTLTITDAEGLQSTASLSITVNPEPLANPPAGAIPCSVGGSRADVPGEKIWCWNSLASEINSAGPLASFSSGELAKSVNYDGQGVRVSNGRLRFSLNPTNSGNGNNYRSEIRENPSNVDHALGTEQWFGWDYKFENDYKADAANEWIMWQVHGSFSNPANPLVSLWVAKENMARQTNAAGEIFVANAAINTNNTKYVPTGIVPQAGQTLKIVVHVIWGNANTGLYEIWINGNKIYSQQERTVYVEQPEGGYAKWGIYKWKWQSNSNVSASENQGITELNTSMGTLRSVMRRLGDAEYGNDAYSLVAPE